ncbi:zinc-dependent alcohol dehydrogenase [Micromonospora pisi]|nr:zinc-dependent alcohol dehydrogenase [Micromonospora pisi]
MRAAVWHGVGDIRLDEVPDPRIEEPTDAIVRITRTAICGTDLHFARGTVPGLSEGSILGHEGVGQVVQVGSAVRNFSPGDRVVVSSTISCGFCSYCRAGYQAQCDNANPGGRRAGTAYFGAPASAGGFAGLQAEYARIPYASNGLVALPDDVSDDEAILLSDIFPTAWFGARIADVSAGDTVAVFGCGPVGQLAILSAQLQGAGRVIAVDQLPDRLATAKGQHAEVVDFSVEDPVSVIDELTGGIGVDRAIDAVGVDAQHPTHGPAARQAEEQADLIAWERGAVAAQAAPQDDNWVPGNAPGQALRWAVDALAKAGTLGIIGVYPPTMTSFPTGIAMNKNLTIKAGNANHRHYLPQLVEMIGNGTVDPSGLVTEEEPIGDIVGAYREFDRREPGWLKVAIDPTS